MVESDFPCLAPNCNNSRPYVNEMPVLQLHQIETDFFCLQLSLKNNNYQIAHRCLSSL